MQDSKLIMLLKTLNSRELSRFEDYVFSPYFNKHEQVRELCRYLVRYSGDWEHPRRFQKELIYRQIYPKKAFDAAQMNRLASMLLDLLHEFLVSERLHSEEKVAEHKLLLLEELRKKKSDKDYQSALQQYHRATSGVWEESPDAYYYKYRLHRELDARFIDKGGRQFDENLQLKNTFFDIFFLVEKLRIACDMINRNIIVRSDYRPTILEELIKMAEAPEMQEIPSVRIYIAILNMRRSESPKDEPYYQSLKQLLAENSDRFAKAELMNIYSYILNHCAKKINEGQTHYYQETLEAYQFLVGNRIIFTDGFLPAWDYKNIVTVAIRVQHYTWAEQFIQQYKKYLPPDVRDNAYRYNLAAYQYAVKNYGEALRALHNVDFSDPSLYIGAKTIQMKSYYELNEGDALESLIEAFSTYLHRHKELSEYWRQSNLNTLKILKKIHKVRLQQDYLRRKKVEDLCEKINVDIQKTSPLANKDWLLECLEQLS